MERKLATVLFVDLVGSTALVAASDPEVVRRRVTRFFDEVTHCVTTHGGIVEKFAGDAVMAAFGVAQAHEDDAERAVRAAIGIIEAVARLELEARIGIESGEVVVDTAESTFATGEAVNLAARLQQSAAPGEILVGPAARSLALDTIEAEEIGPLQVKGREAPLPAWRVICAADRALPPPPSAVVAPLIGRDSELEMLANTFERAARDRRAHLVTIYGEPGVGKSRLTREFVASLEGATVLSGRCLPYGEGITYWPLAEMVKSAAGISDDDPVKDAMEKLRACCEDEAVADLLGLTAGVLEAVEGDRSGQEIAWAARAWADQLADVQPLVLVFEDIHWAEEPLLELIEHLVTWVREAPLLLVCLARPELIDIRPGWGGGRMRAAAIELDPLRESESIELIEALLPGNGLPPEARRDLLDKTEGNPLFVEETIRMLIETDGGYLPGRIPDTLQALIAARIDGLPPAEKALLNRAAVIGRIFWHGALTHVAAGLEVDELLDDLLLRDFVLREARSTIIAERAYRFKHMLIREVAYGGLAKAERAELHTRFAEWLRERAGDELLEIRAYHLDQATLLHEELDSVPPELAAEAAAALEDAGKRALAREANRSARKLLLRAVELEPTLERRYSAARAAWRMSDLPAVSVEMERVLAGAREEGESTIEGKALTALAEVALLREANLPKATELIDAALEVLPEDDRFVALSVRGQIAWFVGDFETGEQAAEEALELARAKGRTDLEAQALNDLWKVYHHRGHLDEADELMKRTLELAEESGSIVARGQALHSAGSFHLERGEPEQARPLLEEAQTLFAETGDAWMLGRTLNSLAWAAQLQGDQAGEERLLRDAIRLLKPLEDRGALCESQRALAEVLISKGKLDEAERLAVEATMTVGDDDLSSQATTTMTLGLVRAAQGRDADAEALLLEALEVVQHSGFRRLEGWITTRLEEFLRSRGRDEDAARYRERLAELEPVAGVAAAFASRIERIS